MKVKAIFTGGCAPLLFAVLATAAAPACGDPVANEQTSTGDAGVVNPGLTQLDATDGDGGPTAAAIKAVDVPIDGLSAEDISLFNRGDALFDLVFREVDGLGPYFVRSSCGACHADAARGPGLVQKMAVVEADGVSTASDQSLLKWGPT